MAKSIQIDKAVRGAFRAGNERIGYDLAAGEHDAATLNPKVLERLLSKGLARVAPAKKTLVKEEEQ